MKQLCVSAFGNRIYDSNVSKKNPNLMVGQRVDRTDEVIGAFLQYLLNQCKGDKEKGIKIEYPIGTLTFIKKNPEEETEK